MTEIKDGRLGVTLLDSDFVDYAENDELMVNKRTGRLFYKNKIGEIIDIFDRYASNVSEERLNDLEEIMHQVIRLVTENGPAKMVHFRYALTATENEQKIFKIPLTIFNKDTDLLILNIASSIPLEETQYTINDNREIILTNGIKMGTRLMILIMKNVPYLEDGEFIDGEMIKTKSIGLEQISDEAITELRNHGLAEMSVGLEHLTAEAKQAIESGKLTLGSVSLDHLTEEAKQAIESGKLTLNSVSLDHLTDEAREAIESGKLTLGSVTLDHLTPEAIEELKSGKLTLGSVSLDHLTEEARQAIESGKLTLGSVSLDHLTEEARESLESGKLTLNSVGIEHMTPEAVQELKSGKLTEKSVGLEHLTDEVQEMMKRVAGEVFLQNTQPTTGGTLWLSPVGEAD